MRAVVFDGITSEATGFPKENLLDNNPDTAWRPTSTATQLIELDFGSGVTVLPDVCFLFVHNYSEVGTANATPQYSDDGSSWSAGGAPTAIGSLTEPIKVITITESSAHRYWGLALSSLTGTLPDISMLHFCVERDVGQGNDWPENDQDVSFNITIDTNGGRVFKIAKNRNTFKRFTRQFTIPIEANYTALRNAVQDCRVDRWPLLYYDASSYILARIDDASFTKNEISYQIYQPTITFAELPYIESGESY